MIGLASFAGWFLQRDFYERGQARHVRIISAMLWELERGFVFVSSLKAVVAQGKSVHVVSCQAFQFYGKPKVSQRSTPRSTGVRELAGRALSISIVQVVW